MTVLAEMKKSILKSTWNCKELQIAKTILKKNDKIGRLTYPNLKTYHKATVIKTIWYWHKNKHMDQWERIESPETNLSLINDFQQGCQHYLMGKE